MFLSSFLRVSVLLIGFSIFLGSCRSTSPVAIEPSSTAQPQSSPKSTANPTTKPTTSSKPKNPTSKTISLNIFRLDNQCNRFISEKASVAANQPVTQAIAKVLETVEGDDLDLSGYRVRVASGVATIDFRVAPESRRSLTSLSNCEQLALYGSLRRTLTQNPALKIKSVRFTDRGKLIKAE